MRGNGSIHSEISNLLNAYIYNNSASHPDRLCEHYGYNLMIIPALTTPEYQMHS